LAGGVVTLVVPKENVGAETTVSVCLAGGAVAVVVPKENVGAETTVSVCFTGSTGKLGLEVATGVVSTFGAITGATVVSCGFRVSGDCFAKSLHWSLRFFKSCSLPDIFADGAYN
jgi:hypothetical protein